MADNHFLRMIGLCGESASMNNQYLRIISSRDKSSFPPPTPHQARNHFYSEVLVYFHSLWLDTNNTTRHQDEHGLVAATEPTRNG